MKKTIFLTILICLFCFTDAFASTITVDGLSSHVGYADMNGMEVTVTFGDGTYETETWATSNTTSDTSGVSGTGWQLAFTGDDTYPTYPAYYTPNNPWHWDFSSNSSNTTINTITINALPGNTVFDIYDQFYNKYTDGSDYGYWTGNDPTPGNSVNDDIPNYKSNYNGSGLPGAPGAQWTFIDPVQIVGTNGGPLGDVYTTLQIVFTSPSANTDVQFSLDTDAVVPEPATLLLFGLGLLGIGVMTRKKIHIKHFSVDQSAT